MGNSYKIHSLELLRFLAALMVLFYHSIYYARERLGSTVDYEFVSGSKGVDIFFVISGAVMVISTKSLIGKRFDWLDFFNRRLIRILPIYWLAIFIKLFVMLIASSAVLHADLDFGNIIKSLFFIPSVVEGEDRVKLFIGVAWTLAFEMYFYSLFAFALFLNVNVYKFVAFGVLVPFVFSLFKVSLLDPVWFLANDIVLEFYFGMVVGWLYINRIFLSEYIAFACFCVSSFFVFFVIERYGLPRSLIYGVPSMILVYSLLCLEKFCVKLVTVPVLYLASASYSIYLMHPLISPLAPTVMNKIGFYNVELSIAFSIILGVVVPVFIYKFFESPVTNFLNVKHKFFIQSLRNENLNERV